MPRKPKIPPGQIIVRNPPFQKQDIFLGIEGFYITEILFHLNRIGILDELVSPKSAKTLAKKYCIDPQLTSLLLEFLSETTQVVTRKTNGMYHLTFEYRRIPELNFHLEKFVGAYGSILQNLIATLKTSSQDSSHLDEKALAVAFSGISERKTPIVPGLIRQEGIRYLLDLACGPASMLIELCQEGGHFRGLGVDASSAMCRIAKARIRDHKFSSRIRIRHADARNLAEQLTKRELDSVDGIYGGSFLNEFFRNGNKEAIKILQLLKKLFPGRSAWFIDYYGKLGWGTIEMPKFRQTLLHDLAQSVSRQGVPPPSIKIWRQIYKKAGCRLVEAQEHENNGIEWFIHKVKL